MTKFKYIIEGIITKEGELKVIDMKFRPKDWSVSTWLVIISHVLSEGIAGLHEKLKKEHEK